jgi:hypothetical protein
MRKPAYNALEIARSIVVAILKRSRIDLINCRDLPPLPDYGRRAVEKRGHLWKGLIASEHGRGATETQEPLFGRKVPVYLRLTRKIKLQEPRASYHAERILPDLPGRLEFSATFKYEAPQ